MLSLARRLATAQLAPRPTQPVPIVLVITELEIGGAERALTSLALGLARSRWEVSVVGLGPEGPLARPLREAGLRVDCLGMSSRRPFAAFDRLSAFLRERRPLLVQSFLFHANLLARLAGRRCGVPWILGGLRVAEREKRWHLALDRRTQRLACGSVCVSEGVRQFSIREAGLDPERLIVIPNGLSAETLAAIDQASPADLAELGLPRGIPMALFVGRLEPQKGVRCLLDSARILLANRPDWHMVLIGDGRERTALEAVRASDPLLASRVHLLGRRGDVPRWLRAARFLVLPSLWEGMPNVVLEAMAAQLPVVGTDVEGTRDLVLPGSTGWLVPPGDPRRLAIALEEAAADPERRGRYGQAARDRVENHYALSAVVEAYDRLWSRLLGFQVEETSHGPDGPPA